MKRILPVLFWSVPLFATSPLECTHSIHVHNSIKPQMLEYHFLRTAYSPDSFKLQIDGKELKPGNSLALSNNQKIITVRYDYSFAKGWRTGAKEIIFELDPESKDCKLEFSWDNQWRIVASSGKPLKVKRLKYQA